MAKVIPLTKGTNAIIDDNLFDYISQWKWYNSHGYAVRSDYSSGKRVLIQMHRLILNPKSELEVDHINRNKLDNRLINLRECTHKQNSQNKGYLSNKINKSGVTGVYLHRIGKWQARIWTGGRDGGYKSLGFFIDINDATRAYKDAAMLIRKEFVS